MIRKILAPLLCAGALVSACMPAAHANAYPDRPIRLIVPYGPGGASDIFARVIAKNLTERLKQPVIVENRPGAGGSIGAEDLVRSDPDGYTMLLSDVSIYTISPELYPDLPYKAKNLAPVINISLSPQLLITASNSKLKSFQDVLAQDKAHPDSLNIASSGNGTDSHLAAVLLNNLAGTHLQHVPYKGGGPALSDVVSGHVDMMFIGTPPAMPLISSGQLRVLAVSTKTRMASLPNVPTLAESGAPGYETLVGQGIFFPGGTPPAIVDQMNREITQIMALPDTQKRWSDFGADPVQNTSAQFKTWLQAETDKWGKIIHDANIRLD